MKAARSRLGIWGLGFCSLLGLSTRAVGAEPSLADLARQALAGDAAASAAAVAGLRAAGPAGMEALLALARSPWDERWTKALDAVCAQRDCAATHLYWYTDLEKAEAAARASDRPILSLRLLGRLDEEMSCANSRFFRTVLYPDEAVARRLREHFVLHWQSVRPVPRVTIDFGDGRTLSGTLTGNSIHYVLDPSGRLVDAIPGLYGPGAFLRLLAEDEAEAREVAPLAAGARGARLAAFHRDHFRAAEKALGKDLARSGPFDRTPPAAGRPRTAIEASRLAMSKSASEVPILRALAPDEAGPGEVRWENVALLHREDWTLGEASLAVLRAKHSGEKERWTAKNFELALGQDTERNEFLFHQTLRGWLSGSARDMGLDDFNERVYAELFLTPGDDPWLGLSPPDVFSGLARGGRVVEAAPAATAAEGAPRAAADPAPAKAPAVRKPHPRLTAPSSP